MGAEEKPTREAGLIRVATVGGDMSTTAQNRRMRAKEKPALPSHSSLLRKLFSFFDRHFVKSGKIFFDRWPL